MKYNESKYESLELATKDQIAIEQKAKEAGVIPEEYIAKNPLDKAVQDLKRHTEDYVVAEQYLDQANKIDQYTDPVKAEKIHREHLNPIVEAYKNKGKTSDVEISDKPVYQKYTNSKGKDDFQQVNALFTPAKSVASLNFYVFRILSEDVKKITDFSTKSKRSSTTWASTARAIERAQGSS